MSLDGVKIDGSTALLTGLKVPCEKVNELLSSKVAPQLLHSGRGRGGSSTSGSRGSSPQQRQQEGQQGGGSTSDSRPPAEAAGGAAGGVEGRMGVGEESVGWGRMQQLWGNYNAIQSLLTRHF